MKKSKTLKIETYCPRDSVDKVRLAIWEAGWGKIGNYTYCAFLCDWHGYFLPMEGAKSAIGKQGSIEKVAETKIEFVCEADKVETVIEAIKQSHPYEEVPIFVSELLNPKS